MERKLRSKAGQAIYAVRKTVVEPVFGLMATTHNILKLFRASLATP